MKVWDLLDQFVTREQIQLPSKPALWPSEASIVITDRYGMPKVEGKCMRAAYLRYVSSTGMGSNLPMCHTNTARSEYIFMMGRVIERELTLRLKEAGVWVANSIKYYDAEHNISGEVDCIIWDPETKKETPLECKTFYSYKAKADICGTKSRPGFPRWSNLLQIALYLDFLRDTFENGKLMYMARDSVDRTEFDVEITNHEMPPEERRILVNRYPVSDFTMGDIYNRLAVLQAYIDAGELPPNDYVMEYSDEKMNQLAAVGALSKTNKAAWEKKGKKIGDWNCSYCGYSHFCWPETRDQASEEDIVIDG